MLPAIKNNVPYVFSDYSCSLRLISPLGILEDGVSYIYPVGQVILYPLCARFCSVYKCKLP